MQSILRSDAQLAERVRRSLRSEWRRRRAVNAHGNVTEEEVVAALTRGEWPPDNEQE